MNSQMTELMQRYVTERTEAGDLTGKSPEATLGRLMSFARSCNLPPTEVTKHDVRRWMASLDLRPASRRAYLSSLTGFFRWMCEEDMIPHDPTAGVKRPKIPKGENRSLTDEELDRIRHVLPDQRAWVIFCLMLNEGLRAGEVAAALVHDVDFPRSLISVRGKGYQGQRSRTVPMTAETLAELRKYLDRERITAGPLIRAQNFHDGLKARTISKMMSQWMAKAGVKHGPFDGTSAHALRHTAAEQIADLTDNVRVVQAFLGHANVATTQTYLRRPVSGVEEIQALRGVQSCGEILDGGPEAPDVVFEMADAGVAGPAEESPDLAC